MWVGKRQDWNKCIVDLALCDFVCSFRYTVFVNWKHFRLLKEEFRFGVRIAKFTILVRNASPQNAPLTEQQQAAIVALSHAVAERPFPANLVVVPSLIMVCLAILLCELDDQVVCVSSGRRTNTRTRNWFIY